MEQKAFALMRRIKRARTPFLSRYYCFLLFQRFFIAEKKKKRRRRKKSLPRIGQWNFSPFSSPGTGGEELLRRFLELRLESPEFSIPLLATVSTHRESNRATSYSPIFEIAALRIRRGCELFKELLIRNIIFPDYSRSYFFRNNFMQLSKLEAEYQRRII